MGSTRFRQRPWTPVRELGIIPGSFAPASTAAVTDVLGDGFTISRASTGVFTVTLDKTYPRIISVVASLQSATGSALKVEVDDLSGTSSDSVFVLRTVAAAGTATDIAADANNRIGFCAYVKNTGVS